MARRSLGLRLLSLVTFGVLAALLSGAGGTPAAGPGPAGVCGGIAGFVCGAHEWCEFDIPGSCGRDDVMGKCRPRPESCLFDCVQVTGCDGKRYCNACLAHQAGTDVDVERERGEE